MAKRVLSRDIIYKYYVYTVYNYTYFLLECKKNKTKIPYTRIFHEQSFYFNGKYYKNYVLYDCLILEPLNLAIYKYVPFSMYEYISF